MKPQNYSVGIQSCLMILFFSVVTYATAPGTNPIHNAYLQDPLNGNGQSITNVATVSASSVQATSITVGGVPVTPGPGLTLGNSATNAAPGTNSPSYAPASGSTNYPSSSTVPRLGANAFTGTQSATGFSIPTFPAGGDLIGVGDSRIAGFGIPQRSYFEGCSVAGCFLANICEAGVGANMFGVNLGYAGDGIETAILQYHGANEVVTTGNITNAVVNNVTVSTITITGSTAGFSSNMSVGGIGIPPGMHATYPGTGTVVTLEDDSTQGRFATAATGVTLVFSTAPLSTATAYLGSYMGSLHQLSPAVSGVTTSRVLLLTGINDVATQVASFTCTNGSPTVTGAVTCVPIPGYVVSGTGIAAGTVVNTVTMGATGVPRSITFTLATSVGGSAVNYTGSTGSVSLTFTPNAPAIEAAYTALVNLLLADSYTGIEVMTNPKAYSSTWLAGDAYRTALNSYLLSTYGGGAVSGVNVIDIASMPCFATNDPAIYIDGLHFTALGHSLVADFAQTTMVNQFPSALTGTPFLRYGNLSLNWDQVRPPAQMIIGGVREGDQAGNVFPTLVIQGTGPRVYAEFITHAGNIGATEIDDLIESDGNRFGFFNNQLLEPKPSVQSTVEEVPGGEGRTKILFAQISATGPSATTTETAITGTGTGTLTLPASRLGAGSTLHYRWIGYLATTGTPTLEIKVKLGSTVLSDSGAQTLSAITGNGLVVVEGDIMTTTAPQGAAPTIGQGDMRYYAPTLTGLPMVSTSTTTINTGVTQAFSITAQFSSATGNSATFTNGTLEEKF